MAGERKDLIVKERYLLIRELGRGGFGTVYLALDQNTQRHVAIKALNTDNPTAREQFRREALTLYRQLNNQFIVDLLDHDLDDSPPYLVLEYCEHGSLRSWVGQRRAWQDVAVALSYVIQGLESIHEAGGFHRDLKPDNLLQASGPMPQTILVKIADFGLARVPDPVSAVITRHAAGTDGYIAPEVLGGADFHPGADIYSLGIVATELLTSTRDPAGLHRAKIPAGLRDLVLAMCAADSTRRPSARKIAATLHSLLSAPPPPPPEPAESSDALAVGAVIAGVTLFAAAMIGLAALAGGENKWDASVQRYRGSNGRFRNG